MGKKGDPQETQRKWHPAQLLPLKDNELSLSKLRPYLTKIQSRSDPPSFDSQFALVCRRRICQSRSRLPDFNPLIGQDKSRARLHLADLENWVHYSLNDWFSRKHGTQRHLSGYCKNHYELRFSSLIHLHGYARRYFLDDSKDHRFVRCL